MPRGGEASPASGLDTALREAARRMVALGRPLRWGG